MSTVTIGHENRQDISLYFEDHGIGLPVVLIHGYPLDGRSWEKQEQALLDAGYRVVAYDRRGFGHSSHPTIGFDYDTFTADLNVLMEHLDLHDCTLVGHSMGTGEVVRYLSRYGSARVSRGVLIESLPPYLGWSDDNPRGVERSVFERAKTAISADRPAFFKGFLDDFFNFDALRGTRVSDQAWEAAFTTSLAASPYAVHACVDAWVTDFRDDLKRIDVPILLIHGDADRVLPYSATAARMSGLVHDLTTVTVEGGPHNTPWTHPELVNRALLEFLKR